MQKQNLNLTIQQAIPKIKHFCAYQERCHFEVKQKLYEFGLHITEIDQIITTLIEENYLNETRFAEQYTLGKYKLKYWGRNKIKFALKQKQISTYNINKAMKAIDEEKYAAIILKLAQLHYNKQKGITNIKIHKTTSYLLQKGFEMDIIKDTLQKIC